MLNGKLIAWRAEPICMKWQRGDKWPCRRGISRYNIPDAKQPDAVIIYISRIWPQLLYYK